MSTLTDAYVRDLQKALGAQVDGAKRAQSEARKESARGAFDRALGRMTTPASKSDERDQKEG